MTIDGKWPGEARKVCIVAGCYSPAQERIKVFVVQRAGSKALETAVVSSGGAVRGKALRLEMV